MKESAPFWSMRGRTAHKHADNIPGPGAYSPTGSVMASSPKYRVGTSQRTPLSGENINPGPGTYSPRKGADSPSWTLY